MGEFQKHTACPNCGSRDNLGVYSDGSWCFGCGYLIPGYKSMSTQDIRKQIVYDDKKEKKNRAVYLPDDFTLTLPEIPLAWLRQYGITDQERQRYKIGWSDENESLVFAAFDCFGNLLLVQFRSFRQGAPKYYTRGFPESVYWTIQVGTDFGGAVCVVEDFVSCLRVGR